MSKIIKLKIITPEGVFKRPCELMQKREEEIIKRKIIHWTEGNRINAEVNKRNDNLSSYVSEIGCCRAMATLGKKFVMVQGSSFPGKKSLDLYNETDKQRVQIKSTTMEGNDCSSFGPRATWDKIYFIEIRGLALVIYDISNVDYDNIQVTKDFTFKQIQDAGKRPHFSIKKLIIEPNNIQPMLIYNLT
jgi:hypothetical protein